MTEKQNDDRSFARSGMSLTEIATTLSSSSSSSSFSWSSSAPYSPPSAGASVAESEEDNRYCPQDDERGSGGGRRNNNILIRPYEEASDLEQVHALFAAGMRSHVGTFFRLVVSQPFVALPVTAVAAAMAAIVIRRNGNNNDAAAGDSSCPSSGAVVASLLAAAVAGVIVGLILCAIIFLMISRVFEKYIQHSIRSDLSQIDEVYAKPGAFLVAQDTTTGKIVGSVGGEYKKPQKRDNNNTDEKHDDEVTDEGSSGPAVAVFELRRMSVDSAVQRRGLGRRLIAALEREIAIAAPTAGAADASSRRIKIILTCTSMQYAAHRLYRGAGFCLVRTKQMSDGNVLFKGAMRIFSFEKEYCFKGNNHHGKNSNSSNKDNNTALAK